MGDASPGTSSLVLSNDVLARVTSAASSMRMTPNDLISQLLRSFYSTLRGLPPHVLFYIFTFLDYSTVSAVVALTCRDWQDAVKKGELAKFFAALRQVHGVHVIDPVRGVFYLPRALKRVLVMSSGAGPADGKNSPSTSLLPAPTASTRQGVATPSTTASRAVPSSSSDMATPASSFLTVDIRTQDTRTLPWATVHSTVERAIEAEKVQYGEIRTPGLQRPEGPVLAQAAVIAHERRIYVFGGESYEGVVLGRCFVYDPMRKRWDLLPPLREPRASACAAMFGALIFIFGGYDQSGEVLDTYEVFDIATGRWQNGVAVNGSSGFHMPSKACGLAATRYEDVVVLVGGCQRRHAPEDTAFTFSAANSASATPVTARRSATSPLSSLMRQTPGASVARMPEDATAAGVSPTTSIAGIASSPPAGAMEYSISRDGPLNAETWVWVFAPRTHRWCTEGVPALPTPRAFGALTVLALAPLGDCLCYFGGCAKADTPETAMLFVPLAQDPQGRHKADSSIATTDTGAGTARAGDAEAESCAGGVGTSERMAQPAWEESRCGVLHDPASATAAAAATTPNRLRTDTSLVRYFRADGSTPGLRCDWQRYARVPLGGAFTSVAVLGTADSRTVVLSCFYPAPLIGCCKVHDLVPTNVATQLAAAITPRVNGKVGTAAATKKDVPPAPSPPSSPQQPPPLDTTMQQEAFAAAEQRRHQEREWSHHQRRELRHLMGAAASAASLKRPLNPQTAGEERKWSLAPMAEVQVRDDRGRPLLNRVSWKTQSLNGKFIVGIE